ncbi:MAG TPA: hypothetical protein VNC21_08685 [Vicinamibacterales bacterium]|nr:hypothetical protein [Vicinamibacterales bacterium]
MPRRGPTLPAATGTRSRDRAVRAVASSEDLVMATRSSHPAATAVGSNPLAPATAVGSNLLAAATAVGSNPLAAATAVASNLLAAAMAVGSRSLAAAMAVGSRRGRPKRVRG